MKEKDIENYFVWTVARAGGRSWKFTSPGRKGVADRIACFPDGSTWFVELKTDKGRLSELQKQFALDMIRLNQKYLCLWNEEQIDEWANKIQFKKC